MKGKDILRLIPQRKPFIMVDEATNFTEVSCNTYLSIGYNNYFVVGDDELSETGLIEHMAQSASVLAGYKSLFLSEEGGEDRAYSNAAPPVGIIGEVKRFNCHRRPLVGERLETTIRFGLTFGNVTLADGECRIGDELIADIKLKIFIE